MKTKVNIVVKHHPYIIFTLQLDSILDSWICSLPYSLLMLCISMLGTRLGAVYIKERGSRPHGLVSSSEQWVTLCEQYCLQGWRETWTCFQFWFSLDSIMNHALHVHHQIWTRDSSCITILNCIKNTLLIKTSSAYKTWFLLDAFIISCFNSTKFIITNLGLSCHDGLAF